MRHARRAHASRWRGPPPSRVKREATRSKHEMLRVLAQLYILRPAHARAQAHCVAQPQGRMMACGYVCGLTVRSFALVYFILHATWSMPCFAFVMDAIAASIASNACSSLL